MNRAPATKAGWKKHAWITGSASGIIPVDTSGCPLSSAFVLAMADGNGDATSPDTEVEEELDQGLKGVNYLCKFCRRKITTSSERIAVNGQHVHICANPYGLLFEVGCFARAAGCQSTGIPTTEFTWFPGYAWSLALCAGCSNHLGWCYVGQPPSQFYGLILSHLLEESSESS